MRISFDNCDVAINNTGIIAVDAAISTENSVEAAYAMGFTRPINQIPYGPIKISFNSSYIPEISQEPNMAAVNRIKSIVNQSGYFGEKVELAGLTHNYCYLDNYSLKISPNNLVEASVSYITFWELCGDLREKSNRINYSNKGDICHSWTTYILSSGDYASKPVYDFVYSFRANWAPVYIIGSQYPTEVKLLSAQESIQFSTDTYRGILFTGENVYPNIMTSNNGLMQFKNLSLTCSDACDSTGVNSSSLSIDINDFKIKNISPVVKVGDFLRVNYIANKYY